MAAGFVRFFPSPGTPYLWQQDGTPESLSVVFYIDEDTRQCKQISVDAVVKWSEEKLGMLGWLLVLLEDRLPRLFDQPSTQGSGGIPRLPFVSVECFLSFGVRYSMWAPLAPLLGQLLDIRVSLDDPEPDDESSTSSGYSN